MSSPESHHDVLIVGGGPAGCAAASAARRRRLRTLVLERDARPAQRFAAGWVGPAALRQLKECGLEIAALAPTTFDGVRLRSWDFSQAVDVHDPELTGIIVDRAALADVLLKSVAAAGAEVRRNSTVEKIRLGETAATITTATGEALKGGIVILADGADSGLAAQAQLMPALRYPAAGAAAAAVVECDDAGIGVDVVLGARGAFRVAVFVRHKSRIQVLMLTGDASVPAPQQLDALLAAAEEAGAIPAGRRPAVRVPRLSGVALEMDTHVGKRCLLVGDAGGFVASFSNEGLYPALRSGWLAGQTAARALSAEVLQDELATFSAAWRADLAEYLRMPNTDLTLLLPMIFNNPQMSRRVARAFLLGQSF